MTDLWQTVVSKTTTQISWVTSLTKYNIINSICYTPKMLLLNNLNTIYDFSTQQLIRNISADIQMNAENPIS